MYGSLQEANWLHADSLLLCSQVYIVILFFSSQRRFWCAGYRFLPATLWTLSAKRPRTTASSQAWPSSGSPPGLATWTPSSTLSSTLSSIQSLEKPSRRSSYARASRRKESLFLYEIIISSPSPFFLWKLHVVDHKYCSKNLLCL